MAETLESLRADLTQLEGRFEALLEAVKHVVTAVEKKSQAAQKKPDFSHIPGHIRHS
jgi:hypothetical protein